MSAAECSCWMSVYSCSSFSCDEQNCSRAGSSWSGSTTGRGNVSVAWLECGALTTASHHVDPNLNPTLSVKTLLQGATDVGEAPNRGALV